MGDWKTLNQETLDIGGNNFLEITVKQPPEGDKTYIGISKGWSTEDGEKRYKTNILFDKDKKEEIIKILENIDKE
jgi:hypothetical protein